MKIGDLGTATNTKVETIRYYERIGLLPPPARTTSNYRHYTEAHRQRLDFIRHARGLGFEIAEIRSLLDLADDPERDCSEADRIASEHLRTVEEKIARLSALRDELARVVGVCRGGQVASCRVLEALGDHSLCATTHAHAGVDTPVSPTARR
jgi:Cu(I)-responsive transcriptional regulator